MPVTLCTSLPGTTEFIAMRTACGFGGNLRGHGATRPRAGGGNRNGIRRGTLVGFGRVVGDGVLCFYFKDIIVAPTHRGQGLAGAMIQRLLDEIAPLAGPKSTRCATGGTEVKHFFGAILGNAFVLLVIVGVPLLSLVFLPYDYGMPLILLWVGGLVLLWVVFLVRAILRRGKSGSQDEDAS